MRTFTDANGTEWTVFEVKRQLADVEQPRWSYLPEGYSDGWLCFESRSSKRRLMRVPERWRELPLNELETLLASAQPVNRAGRPINKPATESDSSEAR